MSAAVSSPRLMRKAVQADGDPRKLQMGGGLMVGRCWRNHGITMENWGIHIEKLGKLGNNLGKIGKIIEK